MQSSERGILPICDINGVLEVHIRALPIVRRYIGMIFPNNINTSASSTAMKGTRTSKSSLLPEKAQL
jgi:hypothetical protein